MEEHQHGGAQHGECADQQRHARRQRRGGNQHRAEQQERERVLQAAGEIEQCRQLGDIEAQQPGGAVGFEPLRLGKAKPQRHVEQHRDRDDGEAGPDRNHHVVEAEMHHQQRRELAEDGEPSQADKRIQPHIARPIIASGQSRTCKQCSGCRGQSKRGKVPLATAAPMRETGVKRGEPV